MRVSARWLVWCFIGVLTPVRAAAGQSTLSEAAARAKQAVSAHDAPALVGKSSNVVLQIPGADASSPLGRSQAIELLRRYLRPAQERGLDVTAIREVEPGKGFIELTRRYVVSGTSELRHETLYLGYRLLDGEWRLVELRSAP
jgi:hypothetical protein